MKKTFFTIGSSGLFCILFSLFFCCARMEGQNVPRHQDKKARKDSITADISGDRISASERFPKPIFIDGTDKFTSKTEIVTIGSSTVGWQEFYFWLKFIQKHYRKVHRINEITDWRIEQNGMPLKEFFLSSAVGYACKERAIEAKSLELGVDLSADDWRKIEQTREKNIKIYGRSEYLRMIRRMYVSEEVFSYLTRMDRLGMRLFAHLYGENGEKCPEKNVSACQKLFRSQVEGWCAELDIVYAAAYHKIDPESIFR